MAGDNSLTQAQPLLGMLSAYYWCGRLAQFRINAGSFHLALSGMNMWRSVKTVGPVLAHGTLLITGLSSIDPGIVFRNI
jgi:hypothetical protein